MKYHGGMWNWDMKSVIKAIYFVRPQWAITSHLSEWQSSKWTQITNAGKDMKKRETFYSVGRNVNCGNLYWGLSKN